MTRKRGPYGERYQIPASLHSSHASICQVPLLFYICETPPLNKVSIYIHTEIPDEKLGNQSFIHLFIIGKNQ